MSPPAVQGLWDQLSFGDFFYACLQPNVIAL